MRALLTIISILYALLGVSQSTGNSNLITWNNQNLPDTSRLLALHEYIDNNYSKISPDSIFYLAHLQYELATVKELPRYQAKALNTKGKAYSLLHLFDKAIELHLKSLDLCKRINCQQGIMESVINLGNAYFEKKNFDMAIDYFYKGVTAAKLFGDKMSEANSWNDLAVTYKKKQINDKAIECFEHNLKILEDLSYDEGMAHTLCNLAVINAKKGEFEIAISQFLKTYAIQKELNLTYDMSESLMNIANLYDVLGDSIAKGGNTEKAHKMYAQAIMYNSQALELAQKVGSVIDIKRTAKDLISEYYKRETIDPHSHNHSQSTILSSSRSDSITNTVPIQLKNGLPIIGLKQENAKRDSHYTIPNVTIGFLTLIVLLGLIYQVNKKLSISDQLNNSPDSKTINANTIDELSLYENIQARPRLNKELIQNAANGSLNDSDWNILHTLYSSPGINNRGISEHVALSVDGVRSSLRKMYRIFEIPKSKKNQRITLILIAIKISNSQNKSSF